MNKTENLKKIKTFFTQSNNFLQLFFTGTGFAFSRNGQFERAFRKLSAKKVYNCYQKLNSLAFSRLCQYIYLPSRKAWLREVQSKRSLLKIWVGPLALFQPSPLFPRLVLPKLPLTAAGILQRLESHQQETWSSCIAVTLGIAQNFKLSEPTTQPRCRCN